MRICHTRDRFLLGLEAGNRELLQSREILVVEDDLAIRRLVKMVLEREGYRVEAASDGVEAVLKLGIGEYDVIILDLMLPKKSGFDICKELREKGNNTPVIMLTARGQEIDKIVGLELGADDYVTKPFSLIELLARVEALLRRSRQSTMTAAETSDTAVRFGTIEVHPSKRLVMRQGAPVPLRPKEFDLLMALVRRDGSVAQRAELLREVWGYKPAMVSRTIDTHIVELRRKLEDDPASPRHFLTVRKTGYRFER